MVFLPISTVVVLVVSMVEVLMAMQEQAADMAAVDAAYLER